MPTKEFFKISEFESNIRASFSELRKEEDMIDVTLATDDGTLIDAHKIILSAGSKFFGQLFRHQSKHRTHHSYIYLKGITSSNLDNVVTFLYTGEVYMDRNEVDGFVATAEELDVKGVKSYFDCKNNNNDPLWVDPDMVNVPSPTERNRYLESTEELFEEEDEMECMEWDYFADLESMPKDVNDLLDWIIPLQDEYSYPLQLRTIDVHPKKLHRIAPSLFELAVKFLANF